MNTFIANQKNNLEKLTKVLGIGNLISLDSKINGEWISGYASTDDIVMKSNIRLPIHNCFKQSSSFFFSSS